MVLDRKFTTAFIVFVLITKTLGIETEGKRKYVIPKAPSVPSTDEDFDPQIEGLADPGVILYDGTKDGANNCTLMDATKISNYSTGTDKKQAPATAAAVTPVPQKFFMNPADWNANFKERFDKTILNLPDATHCSKAQSNLITANRMIAEIMRYDGQKQTYLRNSDYRSVNFMGNQEGRLNRLGLFLYPLTWSAQRCGAGVLTNDCGEPWPGSNFPKTGP